MAFIIKMLKKNEHQSHRNISSGQHTVIVGVASGVRESALVALL